MNGNGDRPVTVAELRAELSRRDRTFDEKLERLEERLDARLDAKLEARLASQREEISLDIAGGMSFVVDKLSDHLERRLAVFRDHFEQRLVVFREEISDHLEQRLAVFRGEISDHLEGRLTAYRDELGEHLARSVRAEGEETRRLIHALDDRYRDLPGRVAVLERDLDEHRRDATLHRSARSRRRKK